MSHLEQPGYLTDEQLKLVAELVGGTWLDNQLKRYQQFHEHHSLPSRWWHRPPDMSPIVPLVFWARPSPQITLDAPFGVWRGDPTGILFRLLAAIDEFRDYWDHLPEGRGRGRLRYTLRYPWSFFGIRHEMRLATQFWLRLWYGQFGLAIQFVHLLSRRVACVFSIMTHYDVRIAKHMTMW